MAKTPALVHRPLTLRPGLAICGAGSERSVGEIPMAALLENVTCHRCRLLMFGEHLGERVLYRDPAAGKNDRGKITSVSSDWVFVLFDYQPLDAENGQACDPRSLVLL